MRGRPIEVGTRDLAVDIDIGRRTTKFDFFRPAETWVGLVPNYQELDCDAAAAALAGHRAERHQAAIGGCAPHEGWSRIAALAATAMEHRHRVTLRRPENNVASVNQGAVLGVVILDGTDISRHHQCDVLLASGLGGMARGFFVSRRGTSRETEPEGSGEGDFFCGEQCGEQCSHRVHSLMTVSGKSAHHMPRLGMRRGLWALMNPTAYNHTISLYKKQVFLPSWHLN